MRRSVKYLMAMLAALGVYKLATGRRRGNGRRPERLASPKREGPQPRREPSRQGWDEVDEASYESFPASDPPPYSRGNP